jgi:BirA family transcriptional regulator, biotin operon repressor / biotin---[acetyl-CoA-carboxylase] ligase
MHEPNEIRTWPCQHLGQRVLIFDSVSSTNDLAAQAPEAGTVFIADEQTSGRGQHGRVWQSAVGTSLLMSINLNPPTRLRRPVLLTAWAAVAVADAIFQLSGLQANLKWPNDLLVNGKKVCGILIEQNRSIVLGLGLNLSQTAADFARAELPSATSLMIESGRRVSPLQAAETAVHSLDVQYGKLLADELLPLESEWRSRIALVGRPVVLELLDGSLRIGRLNVLTFTEVVLILTDGSLFRTSPEGIRHITPG